MDEKSLPSIFAVAGWLQSVSNEAPKLIALLQQLMVLFPPVEKQQ